MTYDQAQSPRLGQRTAVESTYVQMFDVDPGTPTPDLVEAAWPGMMIFRADTNLLQIFDGTRAAWRDIGSGNFTYVSTVMPVETEDLTFKTGDVWYDSGHEYQLYIWDEGVLPDGAWVVALEKSLTTQVTTSEALAQGDLVNVYGSGGVSRVRKANAAVALRAHGYVTDAYPAGASAKVHQNGSNGHLSGLTPGMQWLSTTPGKSSATPASAVNSMVQQVGYATDPATLEFLPLQGIKII